MWENDRKQDLKAKSEPSNKCHASSNRCLTCSNNYISQTLKSPAKVCLAPDNAKAFGPKELPTDFRDERRAHHTSTDEDENTYQNLK